MVVYILQYLLYLKWTGFNKIKSFLPLSIVLPVDPPKILRRPLLAPNDVVASSKAPVI